MIKRAVTDSAQLHHGSEVPGLVTPQHQREKVLGSLSMRVIAEEVCKRLESHQTASSKGWARHT